MITNTKRKRMEDDDLQRKQVRFDDQANQTFITYSSKEYDRGGIFAFPVLYKVNPAILQPSPSTSLPKLSLDTTTLDKTSDEEESPQTPSPTKQRPKLTIQTTNLSQDGPSFLTFHRPTEDKTNDYLVPLSATPSFLPFLL